MSAEQCSHNFQQADFRALERLLDERCYACALAQRDEAVELLRRWQEQYVPYRGAGVFDDTFDFLARIEGRPCGTCDGERYIGCGDGERRNDMPCPVCGPVEEAG